METLTCFSFACSSVSKTTTDILKYSNKIILPASMLHKINLRDDVEYPLFFKVTNPQCQFGRVCAVHEFTATEGLVNIPYFIMEDLGIQEGSEVTINYINPPKGSYVKLKPHKTEFINLTNPKAILEKIMSNDYPVITKGETIVIDIKDLNKRFRIDIVETKPSEIIKIINTDLNLDFDEPHDYVEPPKIERPKVNNFVNESKTNNLNTQNVKISSNRLKKLTNYKTTGEFVPFSGKGHVLGSK